jgi:hypothetical protein
MSHPTRIHTAGPRRRRALVFLLVLAAAASLPASANEQRPAGTQAPPSPAAPVTGVDEEIVRYMAVSRPGAEHRWLDPLVGSWTIDLRWQGPGGAETRVAGTSENRWILDGRFLLCESTAGDGPSRIDATTIYGFDNRQKKYFALGLHNLATYIMEPSGSYDPATHSFLLSGKERDEVTGGFLVYRELLKVEGPDRHVLRVYFDVPGRTPVRVIEAVYTRR